MGTGVGSGNWGDGTTTRGDGVGVEIKKEDPFHINAMAARMAIAPQINHLTERCFRLKRDDDRSFIPVQ